MDLLFGFSGRVGRGWWWLSNLVAIAVWMMAVAVFYLIVEVAEPSGDRAPGELSDGGLTLLITVFIASVISVWINAAASVKRLHDRDKSAVWLMIYFVPFIGPLWLLVECGFFAGSPGDNRFGPPPGGGRQIASGLELDIARLQAEHIGRQPAVVTRAVTAQRPDVSGRRQPVPAGFGRRGR